MVTKSSLSEKRNNIFKQMQGLYLRAVDGILPAEDKATFDRMYGETEQLRTAIEDLGKMSEIETMADAIEERVAAQPKDKPTYERSFLNWLKGERQNAEERAILNAGMIQYRGTDTQIAGDPGLGGYTVPETWSDEIYKIMSVWGGVLRVCDIKDTAQGGTMNFPTLNDTVKAAVVTETTAHVVSDTTFTNKTLADHMYGTGIMKATIKLLRDSKYDIAKELRQIIGERMGRGTNYDFTVGAGTTLPFGVVTQSDQGATHSAISRAKLVELKFSVASPYRENGVFMMNSTSMGQIAALAFGSGDDRPLYQASAVAGQPDRIEGHPVIINEDMASVDSGGADRKPVLFGDFKQYKVRRIGTFEIFPFNELFMTTLEKGWLGFASFDGALFHSAAVKHLLTT